MEIRLYLDDEQIALKTVKGNIFHHRRCDSLMHAQEALRRALRDVFADYRDGTLPILLAAVDNAAKEKKDEVS